jgi:hypothetical protein
MPVATRMAPTWGGPSYVQTVSFMAPRGLPQTPPFFGKMKEVIRGLQFQEGAAAEGRLKRPARSPACS